MIDITVLSLVSWRNRNWVWMVVYTLLLPIIPHVSVCLSNLWFLEILSICRLLWGMRWSLEMNFLILMGTMLSTNLEIMLLLIDFLLILLATIGLALRRSLDCDIAMLAWTWLDHFWPTCTWYLQSLCQIACRANLLLMVYIRLACTLRCIIVRHVWCLRSCHPWVDLSTFVGVSCCLVGFIARIHHAMVLHGFVDGLWLTNPLIVLVSRLLLFHGVLSHPSLLLCRHLRFLNCLACHLRATHYTWMLLNLSLVITCVWTCYRDLLCWTSSSLSLILAHYILESLVVKVSATLLFWCFINILRSWWPYCCVGYN